MNESVTTEQIQIAPEAELLALKARIDNELRKRFRDSVSQQYRATADATKDVAFVAPALAARGSSILRSVAKEIRSFGRDFRNG